MTIFIIFPVFIKPYICLSLLLIMQIIILQRWAKLMIPGFKDPMKAINSCPKFSIHRNIFFKICLKSCLGNENTSHKTQQITSPTTKIAEIIETLMNLNSNKVFKFQGKIEKTSALAVNHFKIIGLKSRQSRYEL